MHVGIQALRAIAAGGVLVSHCFFPAFGIGSAGVDLFFVISGFVMVISSTALFGRPSSIREFAIRRITRIVPLYWTVTVVTAMLVSSPLNDIISSLLFVKPSPIYAPGWTLNNEMYFYTIFAACLVMSRRIAVITMTTVLLLLVTLRFTIDLRIPITSPITLEFVSGAWLGVAYVEGVRLPRTLSLALICAGLTGIWFFAEPSGDPRPLCWGIPATAIVAGVSLGIFINPSSRVARALSFLGDASYAIYLVHFLPFGYLFSLRFPAPLTLILTFGAGILVYVYYDKPITRFLRSLFPSRVALAHTRPAAAMSP
jgi:exopolysaccharide production protein ExoZ